MRQRQQFRLTIGHQGLKPLTPAQVAMIQEALNQRFKDASFEISELPEYHSDWTPTELPANARETFEQLAGAETWVDLTGNAGRVAIHRLKRHLPGHLKIITKRSQGYRLVDTRKTA